MVVSRKMVTKRIRKASKLVTTRSKKENCGWDEELPIPILPSLPQVIIVEEILSRLPIKPLIRFRSVCKSWNSLIASDPQFTILQMKNSIRNRRSNFGSERVLLWDFRSSVFFLERRSNESALTDSFTIKKPSIPITIRKYDKIVAACDGLVCVHQPRVNLIVFWNPLTGETKRVSEPAPKVLFPISKVLRPLYVYGLGYDSSTDDYKLVRIRRFVDVLCQWEVRVYSLRTDSWRQVEDFPYKDSLVHGRGFFLKGALYFHVFWHTGAGKMYRIVSFDLGKEKLTLLDIPQLRSLVCAVRFRAMDGKLWVCHPSGGGSYKLWVSGEPDNGESWAGYVITVPDIPGNFSFREWDPVCMLKNGEEVILADGQHELGVYHLRDGTYRNLQIPGMPGSFETITFSETLISPNTYKGNNNDVKKRD